MTVFIVVLPILLILIFFSLFLAVSKGIKLKKNFWTAKRISIVTIGYIGLGLIAFIYLTFTNNNDDYKVLTSEEIEQLMKDEIEFNNFFSQKHGDKFNEKYLVDEWSMELSTDEVTFERESEDTYGRVFVLIDWRNDEASNEIYAKTYQIPYVYEGIDLTKELTKDQFEFTGDKLIVKKPPVQQFTFNSISPKMEMLEMNVQMPSASDDILNNAAVGSTFLYLNVPSHVTIIDEGELRFYP